MKWCTLRRSWPLAALALAGCGGTASAPVSGFQMNIQWPSASRLIPSATQSVRVVVQDAGGFQTFRVANRPTTGGFTTLVFFGLRPGNLSVDARAYPAVDAQGVPLAQTAVQVTVAQGNQTNLQLSLVSTVDRVEVAPTRVDLAPAGTRTLSGTAKDTSGNLVPLSASKTTWVSSDPSIATVDSTGKVTAVKAGSVTITFTDTESGKSGTALVVVS